MLFSRALIEDALPPVQSTFVAHFTRIGTLCHFIPADATGWSSAWATPVQFLNDRKELTLGLEVLRNVASRAPQSGQWVRACIDDLLSTSGGLETDAFQMSFSGNPDELGQWRGYAANGMGCSVVTNAIDVKRVADVAGWVLYESGRQMAFARKALRGLRNERDPKLIKQVLVAAASYIKHPGFQPEMEFRLLRFAEPGEARFRESGDRLVPYIDYLNRKPPFLPVAPLPINKIVVGPAWQLSGLPPDQFDRNHVVQGIQRLLTDRGLYTAQIESSSIPYDPK
jgi:hypothetical protein